MKTLTLLTLILTINLFSQTQLPDNLVGTHTTADMQGKMITTTNPVLYNANYVAHPPVITPYHPDSTNSTLRYNHVESFAIGNNCTESGSGTKSVVGWYLNNQRTSCYGNTNDTPLWEFPLSNQFTDNYVASTPAGDFVASSFYQNIYLLNGTSGSQVWTFSTATYPDTVYAGPIAITSTGNFVVASGYAYYGAADTSYVYGFNNSSNVPVWTYRIPPSSTGSSVMGIKMSGNDSLVIVNTYLGVYVIKTYTGQVIYTGTVNPVNNNGTQSPQGISGNGNIIATINYIGYVRVLQWNGSTYNLLWQNQEPPGTYYNWMASVDVSYDGSMVAAGTLNFITSSTYDGKVKFWSVAGGSTPVWTYAGTGDEVAGVSFSMNGRFLSAASWGNYYNPSVLNLLVFKTTHATNTPWFAANSSGSFFACSVSDDGQTVIGSGKIVHARAFGNGGMMYNLYIDTAENIIGVHRNGNSVPDNYSLSQNYPNPFNPSTTIDYQLPKPGFVNLTVFDVLGQEVKTLVNDYKQAGTYNIKFDASELPSGVYFYKITSGDFKSTKKLTLIK